MRHYVIDPERVMLANCTIGMMGSPFGGVFGELNLLSFSLGWSPQLGVMLNVGLATLRVADVKQ
jgi:hypothetical protein